MNFKSFKDRKIVEFFQIVKGASGADGLCCWYIEEKLKKRVEKLVKIHKTEK